MLLRGLGTPDFDRGMVEAAESGRIEIAKLCKAWGATDFDKIIVAAAWRCDIEIVKLCKKCKE